VSARFGHPEIAPGSPGKVNAGKLGHGQEDRLYAEDRRVKDVPEYAVSR